MGIIENIWWLLVLIGVMIMIHELGHYWAARIFDVRIDTFSFGFGPRLFGFKRGETDFRFSAILLGGYVRMAGEQPTDEPDPRGFLSKPRWQRLIIAAAGPGMNVILAIALLAGLFMVHYPKPASANLRATVGYVQPDSPAAQAGVHEGDIIAEIDGRQNPTWEDVLLKEVGGAGRGLALQLERGGKMVPAMLTPRLDQKYGVGFAGWSEETEIVIGSLSAGMDAAHKGLLVGDLLLSINDKPIRTVFKVHEVIRASSGAPVDIRFSRNGQTLQASVNPKWSEDEKRWMIGVGLAQRMIYTKLGLGEALQESVRQNYKGAGLILTLVRGIAERRMSAKSLEGPIGIAQRSAEAAREGAYSFVGLMATVSLNLAVFNLLPIPILDGGVILLLLIEMFIRRDLSLSFKEAVFKLGFVFLMMVVVFVLYNDISKRWPG
jgi:regulator of sigma E protease